MSEPQALPEVPKCAWCRPAAPAPNPEAYIHFGRFEIPLCESCGLIARQFGTCLVMAREELHKRGILVGIPPRRSR